MPETQTWLPVHKMLDLIHVIIQAFEGMSERFHREQGVLWGADGNTDCCFLFS